MNARRLDVVKEEENIWGIFMIVKHIDDTGSNKIWGLMWVVGGDATQVQNRVRTNLLKFWENTKWSFEITPTSSNTACDTIQHPYSVLYFKVYFPWNNLPLLINTVNVIYFLHAGWVSKRGDICFYPELNLARLSRFRHSPPRTCYTRKGTRHQISNH